MSDVEAFPGDTLDTEELILQVRDHIEAARSVPMSASVMVNRDELVGLLEEAVQALPEEIRQARWLLKEREEFLTKARREAEEIIDAGRQQAERMVEKTEVVREANLHGRRIVDDAEKPVSRSQARGRGLHRPEVGQFRGRAGADDGRGDQGSGAAPGRDTGGRGVRRGGCRAG